MNMTIEETIQAAAERDALVIGTEETLKYMDRMETVVLADNTPDHIAEQVSDAAEAAGVDVQRLDVNGTQLGSMCGEPFMASVVGIRG